MSMIFFTYRAQIGARKGVMILGRAGIQGFVARTPGFLSTGGCGYGIRVAAKDGRRAAAELRAGGYPCLLYTSFLIAHLNGRMSIPAGQGNSAHRHSRAEGHYDRRWNRRRPHGPIRRRNDGGRNFPALPVYSCAH